ncbi:glycosyltransferase family 2 protein [Candidatus Bathyarchaeota archaeon A05DMB-2]|nr:glycosyltransferase family 2 protein [Candidatus Bathyarchaeota archaeon A05DMB-2]
MSIVIPVYNEEEAIGDDLALILKTMKDSGYDYEIIVVDDGSTDRTAEIVRGFEEVRMIQHPYNRGTGAARTTGLRAARGDVVVMTDGDGSYPNQDIPRLLREMESNGWDMVVGARQRETGTLRWLRSPTKWFIRMLASYLTATKIPDLNSGFKAFRRDLALRYLNILPTTHSWVSTITIAFLSDGYIVGYLPIDYYPRKGRSTFHPISDTYNYLSLVVRAVMYFEPLKVFLPVSSVLICIAFLKLVRDIIFYRSFYVPGITVVLIFLSVQVAAIGLLADLVAKRVR